MANRQVKQNMGCMGWRNVVEDKVTINDRYFEGHARI